MEKLLERPCRRAYLCCVNRPFLCIVAFSTILGSAFAQIRNLEIKATVQNASGTALPVVVGDEIILKYRIDTQTTLYPVPPSPSLFANALESTASLGGLRFTALAAGITMINDDAGRDSLLGVMFTTGFEGTFMLTGPTDLFSESNLSSLDFGADELSDSWLRFSANQRGYFNGLARVTFVEWTTEGAPVAVPEPATYVGFGAAFLGLLAYRRGRSRTAT